MLDARSKQPSFFDTDQICQPLFPPDSFWHRFRELICPLINDEDYACLYCPDRGRPAKSPALLTMVTILQRRENLSDREAEERVRYDLRWKYALGLEVNDEGFDHPPQAGWVSFGTVFWPTGESERASRRFWRSW